MYRNKIILALSQLRKYDQEHNINNMKNCNSDLSKEWSTVKNILKINRYKLKKKGACIFF